MGSFSAGVSMLTLNLQILFLKISLFRSKIVNFAYKETLKVGQKGLNLNKHVLHYSVSDFLYSE